MTAAADGMVVPLVQPGGAAANGDDKQQQQQQQRQHASGTVAPKPCRRARRHSYGEVESEVAHQPAHVPLRDSKGSYSNAVIEEVEVDEETGREEKKWKALRRTLSSALDVPLGGGGSRSRRNSRYTAAMRRRVSWHEPPVTILLECELPDESSDVESEEEDVPASRTPSRPAPVAKQRQQQLEEEKGSSGGVGHHHGRKHHHHHDPAYIGQWAGARDDELPPDTDEQAGNSGSAAAAGAGAPSGTRSPAASSGSGNSADATALVAAAAGVVVVKPGGGQGLLSVGSIVSVTSSAGPMCPTELTLSAWCPKATADRSILKRSESQDALDGGGSSAPASASSLAKSSNGMAGYRRSNSTSELATPCPTSAAAAWGAEPCKHERRRKVQQAREATLKAQQRSGGLWGAIKRSITCGA